MARETSGAAPVGTASTEAVVVLRHYDKSVARDRDDAMKIALAMLKEGAFRGIKLSEDKVLATLGSGKVFAAFSTIKGKVTGAFVGTLLPHWFSDALVGMEFIHFVYPEFRGTDSGAVLLQAFERWAFVNGACGVYMEQMSGIEPARVEAFYKRRGYKRVGVLMEKGLSRVQS